MSDEEVLETTEEVQVVEPSNLDELPAWAVKEIKDLRKENGNRRARSKEDEELREKAAQWEAHLEAQKSESERLADQLTKTAEELKTEKELRIRHEIMNKYKLDEELVDLLTGDEEQMRAKAEVLASKLKVSVTSGDFGGGQRGHAPIKKTTGGEFLESLAS